MCDSFNFCCETMWIVKKLKDGFTPSYLKKNGLGISPTLYTPVWLNAFQQHIDSSLCLTNLFAPYWALIAVVEGRSNQSVAPGLSTAQHDSGPAEQSKSALDGGMYSMEGCRGED